MRSIVIQIFVCTAFSAQLVWAQNGLDDQGDKAERLLYLANRSGLLNDSSAVYLLGLNEYAEKAGLTYYQVQANYMLGKHYLLRLENGPAKSYFICAADHALASEEYELYGFAMDRLGITYVREELPDSALMCFQKALDNYSAHHIEHRQWNSLYGISTVFQFKNDYPQARKYGDEALQSIENLDEEIAETILLNYMMSLASEFDQLEDYTMYLDRYLQNLDPQDLGKDQMHLAAYFSTNDDPSIRVQEIQKAIHELSARPPTLSLLSGYYRLGQAHVELGQYPQAIDAWLKGLQTDRSVGGAGFGLVFTEALSEAYEAIADYAKALVYLRENKAISDSLSNLANTRKIDELQLKFETSQKEQTILEQQFEIERSRRQRNIFFLISALAIGLGLMIIYALRTRLHAQKIIAAKEIKNLKQSHRLISLKAMLRGQEEERKRIAFDLHDGLGGLLSTVKFQFQKVFDQRQQGGLNGAGIHASQLLDDACSEVRRIAHNMMPHALMKMGLNAAIGDLVSALQTSSEVDISFQNLTGIDRFDQEREIMLYRIVQELLHNALKHAGASSIIIQLSQHADTLSLVVEDDGKGFDINLPHSEGLGLQSLNSRVQFLNGTLDIQSSPGTGTTFSIDIPLSDESIPHHPVHTTVNI